MSGLLKDPMFFYGIAFTIFLILAWRYGRAPMLGWLDSEILKIRNELEQARALRAEAESMLASYKAKQVQAMKDAEMIVRHAKEEAQRLKSQAEIELKAMLGRHEQQAAARIRMAEAEAVAALRTAAVDGAMKLVIETLTGPAGAEVAVKLADQAVVDISAQAGAKSKAA